MTGTKYLQCPYCIPFKGGHNKNVPHNVGLFKIKEHNTFLICECQKCKGIFKIRMMGSILIWSDFETSEKQIFKCAPYVQVKMEGKQNGTEEI